MGESSQVGNEESRFEGQASEDRSDERQRSDGYGIARFNKKTGQVTFECWPRFSDVNDGKRVQFPGWPVTFNVRENDGRRAVAKLPALAAAGVVQVVDDGSGEILYTVREKKGFEPPVYAKGKYTVKFGKDKPPEQMP